MKTASFHTTARKAILATLQANRDDLRVHDTREWRFLTDEEFRRLGHAKPSDVSYAGDLTDRVRYPKRTGWNSIRRPTITGCPTVRACNPSSM